LDSKPSRPVDAWLCPEYSDHLETISDLLSQRPLTGSDLRSADINAQLEPSGETPLMLAIWAGAITAAKKLVQAGADLNLRRAVDSVRPLDIAVAVGRAELALMLIEHGAEVRTCLL
jgi:ankyrin repeat protein